METTAQKFSLGRTVITPTALSTLFPEEVGQALGRHHSGDWGDVCTEDHAANEQALREGYRLFSVYRSRRGEKFWIITEADRAVTTVLLPEDY